MATCKTIINNSKDFRRARPRNLHTAPLSMLFNAQLTRRRLFTFKPSNTGVVKPTIKLLVLNWLWSFTLLFTQR